MLAAGTQRFESFAKNTNLGLLSVSEIKDSDVYNSISNKLQQVSDDLKGMVAGLVQSTGLPVDEIKDKLNTVTRAVRDTFTTLKDLTGFSISDIEKEIAGFIPGGPAMQNAFRNLASQCRNSAMSKSPGFKPFKDKAGCGKPGGGKCSSGEVSGLLNKLTGGAIGAIGQTLQSMLRSLMTLANLGYSGGLCKIFSTLMNGLPSSVIQRGAAGVLATVGGTGTVAGVLDVASAIGGISGINPSREIPGLVDRITTNFKIPDTYTGAALGSLYEGMQSAYETIQPGFDKAADGIASIASLGKSALNSDYAKTAKSWLDMGSASASFDQPYAPEGFESATSYIAGNSSSDLSSWFG